MIRKFEKIIQLDRKTINQYFKDSKFTWSNKSQNHSIH